MKACTRKLLAVWLTTLVLVAVQQPVSAQEASPAQGEQPTIEEDSPDASQAEEVAQEEDVGASQAEEIAQEEDVGAPQAEEIAQEEDVGAPQAEEIAQEEDVVHTQLERDHDEIESLLKKLDGILGEEEAEPAFDDYSEGLFGLFGALLGAIAAYFGVARKLKQENRQKAYDLIDSLLTKTVERLLSLRENLNNEIVHCVQKRVLSSEFEERLAKAHADIQVIRLMAQKIRARLRDRDKNKVDDLDVVASIGTKIISRLRRMENEVENRSILLELQKELNDKINNVISDIQDVQEWAGGLIDLSPISAKKTA